MIDDFNNRDYDSIHSITTPDIRIALRSAIIWPLSDHSCLNILSIAIV